MSENSPSLHTGKRNDVQTMENHSWASDPKMLGRLIYAIRAGGTASQKEVLNAWPTGSDWALGAFIVNAANLSAAVTQGTIPWSVSQHASSDPWTVDGTVTVNQGTNPWTVIQDHTPWGVSGTLGVTQVTNPWTVIQDHTPWGVSGTLAVTQDTDPWTVQLSDGGTDYDSRDTRQDLLQLTGLEGTYSTAQTAATSQVFPVSGASRIGWQFSLTRSGNPTDFEVILQTLPEGASDWGEVDYDFASHMLYEDLEWDTSTHRGRSYMLEICCKGHARFVLNATVAASQQFIFHEFFTTVGYR